MGIYPPSPLAAFGNGIDRPNIGLGFETEQVERAVVEQIFANIPQIASGVQALWDQRDADYREMTGVAIPRITIPTVPRSNYFTGEQPSLIDAEPSLWPSITAYIKTGEAAPANYQPDQYDVLYESLFIVVLCKGPRTVAEHDLHEAKGYAVRTELASTIDRLVDAVHVCIKIAPALGGVLFGPIEKPPTFIKSASWSRKISKGETGEYMILQGKQLKYMILKSSF